MTTQPAVDESQTIMEIRCSSPRLDNGALVSAGFPQSSTGGISEASKSPTSSLRASAVSQTLNSTSFSGSWPSFYRLLIFATTFSSMIFGLDTFSVQSTEYNCLSNIICLEAAHVYTGNNSRIQAGRLSLLNEIPLKDYRSGLAYYHQPVRLLDRTTGQSASFNSSFTVDNVWGSLNGINYFTGDGMTFVLSQDNTSNMGADGQWLGLFTPDGLTPVKSVVVEFDTYLNPEEPVYDINANHVSFDFSNITYVAAKNASDANVNLGANSTFYAWVEYSNETQQLEVRVSNLNSRPVAPLVNYTVNLFDVVDEYMWVGFSSSAAGMFSNFYIGNWTFESSLPESSFQAPSPKGKVAIIVGLSILVLSLFLLVCIGIAILSLRKEFALTRSGG